VKITFFFSPDSTSPTSLQFWYPFTFESINKTKLANYASGSPSFDAVLVNNPVLVDANHPRLSTAMFFNASLQQYIVLPAFKTGNNGISIAFWIKSSNNPVATANIFDFGRGSGQSLSFSASYPILRIVSYNCGSAGDNVRKCETERRKKKKKN
jgi:hypothetical protein